ncbi:MAG: iron-containing alcohol dehydrogenase, partial [Bacteroidales bacterium]|nr:iron-containing alcohol dehydrogenase [Bacteroidales bacterium]
HFGKDVTDNLGKTIEKFGKRVLLVYGGGSIKNNGIYDKMIHQLKSIDAEVFEFSGIKPNPIYEDVDAAAKLGRDNNVDVILAVGGGSVIDSAKIISITIPVENSSWDFYKGKVEPKSAIPLISVLTLAATGTEMNPYAVLQNNKTKEKLGWGHKLLFNKHSFLDPQFTFSVPRNQTAYGIVDLIAHSLEAYFGKGEATLSDRFIFSIINEAIEYGPQLLDNPDNYELRAKIMYAATAALNGLTFNGKKSGDWGVHSLGHELSLLYDIPHGASLSIAYPAWMKHFSNIIPERIIELGKNVFNTDTTEKTISAFESFFKLLDCPVLCQEAGITEDKKPEIINNMTANNVSGANIKMTEEDHIKIVELFF